MSKKLQEYTKDELLTYIKDLKNAKQFGLVWEPQFEQVVKDVEEKLPVLEEVLNNAITTGGDSPTHLIIEGDNYHSLSVLNYTHANTIDVIYIDPPYNRGKEDFIYNDKFVDKEDSFRHSKWLSFMSKRLQLAKNLLSLNGIIFISIDDNELTNLKGLCDQLFGEENHIATLSRVTKKAGKSTVGIAKNHDYVLVYGATSNRSLLKNPAHIDNEYKHKDEYYDVRGPYKLNQALDYDTLGYVNSLDFPITYKKKEFYPGKVSKEEHLKRKAENPKDGFRWRWSPKKVEFGIQNEWLKLNNKGDRIYTKTYLNAQIVKDSNGKYSVDMIERATPLSSLALTDNIYSNDNANKELSKILGKGSFDYPKPTSLIETLLSVINKKDITLLDFFAGSGTAAHAILKLNKSDSGKRKFIICTNNENDIAKNVTFVRVKKVINGYGTVNPLPANVRYFKTDFVKKIETLDKLRRELSPACEDMIRIREGAYEVAVDEPMLKIFKNTRGLTAVVYDRFELSKYIKKIEDIHTDSPVHLYVFSYDKSVRDEEMPDDLKHTYETQPIPEGVLEIYRKIFRKNGAQND